MNQQAMDSYDYIGAYLAEVRKHYGLERRQVADSLRIRREYIAAIEDGRFEALPEAVYTRGFVRSYAAFLGLDKEAVLQRFMDDFSKLDPKKQFYIPEPTQKELKPGKGILVLVLAVLLLLAGFWYQDRKEDVEKTEQLLETEDAPAPSDAEANPLMSKPDEKSPSAEELLNVKPKMTLPEATDSEEEEEKATDAAPEEDSGEKKQNTEKSNGESTSEGETSTRASGNAASSESTAPAPGSR
jgi:cytoskeleton protein RodZ